MFADLMSCIRQLDGTVQTVHGKEQADAVDNVMCVQEAQALLQLIEYEERNQAFQ
jgi:hypothetical protein